VPGNFASAININDWGSVGWSLRIFGALASRENAIVLKQDDGVFAFARGDLGMNFALHSPSLLIPNEIWIQACN
jgi:hypothetical protein